MFCNCRQNANSLQIRRLPHGRNNLRFHIIPPSASGNRYRYVSESIEFPDPFPVFSAVSPYARGGRLCHFPRSFPRSYLSDRYGSALCLHLWKASKAAYIRWGSVSILRHSGKRSLQNNLPPVFRCEIPLLPRLPQRRPPNIPFCRWVRSMQTARSWRCRKS